MPDHESAFELFCADTSEDLYRRNSINSVGLSKKYQSCFFSLLRDISGSIAVGWKVKVALLPASLSKVGWSLSTTSDG